MKRIFPLALACLLLCGCTVSDVSTTDTSSETPESSLSGDPSASYPDPVSVAASEIPFVSRYSSETQITLSDDGIRVDGGGETDHVYTSHDIVYYEEKTEYESGLPYGAGSESDMHSEAEASAHTVVNITAPGTYRITGKLSAGQIRIDLGEDAPSDPSAVVELILDNTDITCTVAPAIVFLNVYECDGDWSEETASADVNTENAGANIILEGENTVSGSYVAKIYKDKEGQKKRWKQDGAVYSYMSMNLYGPGILNVFAENEGVDSELHLTINGGDIRIHADNDGINTNEDGISVTTVNGGTIRILAGVGAEGDGIDSNGFITINGGIVISAANPASDSGLDSDMGTFIHAGTVIALGSPMDGAEDGSTQETLNLSFSQGSTGAIVLTYPDGSIAFAYDPEADSLLAGTARRYTGATISSPNLHTGQTYYLFCGGSLSGTHENGMYDPSESIRFEGGTQMAYTGNGFGGMGGFGGGMGGMGHPNEIGAPNGEMPSMPEGEMPSMPEGEMPSMPDGEMPSMPDGEMPSMPDGEMPSMPEGEMPSMPEGEMPSMPEGEAPSMPEGEMPSMPEGEAPSMPEGEMGGRPNGFGGNANGMMQGGAASSDFTLTDLVTSFSGIQAA